MGNEWEEGGEEMVMKGRREMANEWEERGKGSRRMALQVALGVSRPFTTMDITSGAGGRWKEEGGRWKVEGGRWKVEGGRWKVEEGRRKEGGEGGRWKVEGGKWKVEGGRRKEEGGRGGWKVEGGRRKESPYPIRAGVQRVTPFEVASF
jgi:hypothetical protein